MTIRKNSSMTFPNVRIAPKKVALFALMVAGLAGCSSINSLLDNDKVDYKSAGKVTTPNLSIPPDLTQLSRDNRYQVPDTNSTGVATASTYTLAQTTKPDPENQVVAPKSEGDIRIVRDGSQRWLVIKATPETLWPRIKEFWQDSGFLIDIDSPSTGVMETDWAENRAKIPQDFIRNTLGKVFDSLYSTGERDKFRTRLERGADGTTEVFISHRGAEEVLTGSDKSTSVWTARAPDPSLEAEFLARLMVRLGVEETKAKVAVASAPDSLKPRAKLQKDANGSFVQVDESFDRAWRRVGLALDRVGFTVEDRDRTQGAYFVRYVDQESDAQNKEKPGFFGKLFSSSSSKDKDKTAQRYRILVKETNGTGTHISVLNNDGQPELSKTADRILTLLQDQLK
jgi:outer membrane protein assembly factor BamC